MPKSHAKRDKILSLIAIFKLLKAALLVAAGIAALEVLRPSISQAIHHWVDTLSFKIENETAQKLLASIGRISLGRAVTVGLAAFTYAALFTVEGVGLWMGRRWAEYLTVIATASLVPFEIYELVKQVTPPRLIALILNVAVVVYLFRLV